MSSDNLLSRGLLPSAIDDRWGAARSSVELAPDDPRRKLIDEAERVSRMPVEDQRAWIAQLREVFADRPNRDEILDGIQGYMAAKQRGDWARLMVAGSAEKLEAHVVDRLEDLLTCDVPTADDSGAYLKLISQIAVLGHMLPRLKDRLACEDAQELLLRVHSRFLR